MFMAWVWSYWRKRGSWVRRAGASIRRRAGRPLTAAAGAAVLLAASSWSSLPAPSATLTMHQVLGQSTDAAWLPKTLTLALPLPAGAAPTHRHLEDFGGSYPLANWVLAGPSATFLVPMSAAEAGMWFRDALAAIGYQSSGVGSAGGPTGVYWNAIVAVPNSQSPVSIWVGWKGVSRNESLVQYYASEAVRPPRPPSSRVPTNIVRVVVYPRFTVRAVHGTKRVVTRNEWIQRFVALINSEPESYGGLDLGCPLHERGMKAVLYTTGG